MSFLPITFVVLWASAFISAKSIMQDATPFAALLMRFGIVTFGFGVLYLIFFVVRRQKTFLTKSQMGHAAITGIFLHGFYLGGVFWALSHGLSSTLAALIASLQPIIISLLAGPILGEQISLRQWGGIIMGFSGAVIVIGWDSGTAVPAIALIICVCALGASVIGTFYQKRFGQDLPLVPANICQAFAATALHLLLLALFEMPSITVTNAFIAGMAWQILAVSFGAYVMLLVLLQRGTANQTSSLLFLVAPVAAVQAWLVLGEQITLSDIIGLGLASCGVFIATRTKAS